jgi:hypothetical protein
MIPIEILKLKQEDAFGFVVTFSDGTTAGYVVEELLKLRPKREPVAEVAECLKSLSTRSPAFSPSEMKGDIVA